jgi:DNA-binding response OmpR family regulator
MARLLLVEDDPALGKSLLQTLVDGGHEARWETAALPGLEAARRWAPDLVLLDLMLPDRSGLEVLADLRAIAPVIVLTARHSAADKVKGLDLGADDYVTKPFWNEELLARIRAQLRRERSSSARLQLGSLGIDLVARLVDVGGERIGLSPTEFDVLAYLVERRGRAVRAEQAVADLLSGDDATRQALQTHVSRLRKKLGAEGARIGTVWGIGYRFEVGDDDG